MPTHASKVKKDAIRTGRLMEADEETVYVATDMARVATANMPVVNDSIGTFILANCPNNVEPNKQQAMKQEKTVPKGVVDPSPKAAATARLIAGGHCSTNIYIAASKRLWTPPISMIFGSSLTTWIASLIEGLPVADASSLVATFSCHSMAVNKPPIARNPVDNSKGPVGPLWLAAMAANCPAKMATIESPAYA